MEPAIALTIVILWIVIPVLHVISAPNGGAWTPPEGSACPFGPRVGWLVIVVLLGLIGWFLFLRSRKRTVNR